MSDTATELFLESQFEAGAEAEIPREPNQMPVYPPKHVTDTDDEENIDHE